jgi:hypothetical protein
MGHEIDPDDLASLGLLEPRPDGYRVRGMSRFFEPIQKRLEKRDAAKNAGKASAKARVIKLGTAQPAPVPTAPERPKPDPAPSVDVPPPSGISSKDVRQLFERLSNDSRTAPEPAPNLEDSVKRSTDSGQRPAEEKALPLPPVAKASGPPAKKRPNPPLPPTYPGTPFWHWFQDQREHEGHIRENPPDNHDFQAFYRDAMERLHGDEDRLRDAAVRFSGVDHWKARNLPFAAFMTDWWKHVPKRET